MSRRAFTIIELTIVLALVGVIMGLVVVRFDWGSQRQQVIAQARKLGNAIQTYRERAMSEQSVYGLQLDLSEGSWSIHQVPEKNIAALQVTPTLVSAKCERPVKILAVKTAEGLELQTPITIFFDPRGVAPGMSIDLGVESGSGVTLQLDPLVNEVSYAVH